MSWKEFFKEPNIWELSGVILTVFALVVYKIKPKLDVTVNVDVNRNMRIVVYNNNPTKATVTDVYCEICVSENQNFDVVTTIDLVKDHTLAIKASPDHYTFKAVDAIEERHNWYRVRILAPNFLGIRKLLIDRVGEM